MTRARLVPSFLWAPICLAGLVVSVGTAGAVTDPVFNRDIRPILAGHCLQCHGQDAATRKGGLRLDVRDDALKGGKSGKPAIVPGRPEASPLIDRVLSHDPDVVMPPPDKGSRLTEREVAVLRDWIAGGAVYQPHWAFMAPERPVVPAESRPAGGNAIDAFVRARLQREGLQPAAAADRAVLLRRLSLDLIGLPPTTVELDAFLADDAPDAYERQVERLLASPQFGEKWARHWLDVARYADSDGYEKDLPRQQWPWRDWVIRAFNRDLPYDQFIIEQLAGDLLPGATQDQRVATGFLRNGMVNEEGAIIPEQFRIEGLIDRMDCLGKAVLGLTIQCAQCHSHKYDPISQEEYFRLYAFLNNDFEATSWVYTPAQLAQIQRLEEGIRAEQEAVRRTVPDWAARLAAWERRVRDRTNSWEVLQLRDTDWVGGVTHPEIQPDNTVLTLGFRPSAGEMWVTGETRRTNLTALRLEALTHGDLPFGGPGRSHCGAFAVTEMQADIRPLGSTGAWTRLTFTNATADFTRPDQLIEPFFHKGTNEQRRVGPPAYLVDGRDDTAWSADRGPGRRHQDSHVVLPLAGTNRAGFAGGTQFKVTLRYRHVGEDIHGRQNNFLGRFRLAVTGDEQPVADPLSARVRAALSVPEDRRSDADRAAVFAGWLATEPAARAHHEAMEALWRTHPEGHTVLNLAARPPEFRRVTRVLERGNWQKPGATVGAGTPTFLPGREAASEPERLALARWLVDRRAPTTARVAVNRVWQALFGQGLVESPEDFGTRAELPVHPELLDWLAVEFMEPSPGVGGQGGAVPWSTKHLLRLIVTSQTYRQDSRLMPGARERDPRNVLLARGPRFRADAEVVRDLALGASGLLDARMGGPSFFPPVPESLFALSFLKVDFWETAPAPERYRRSLYLFRRRSMPDPALATFDAPNGDAACVRRVRSNTPLAALTALNEPVFVEAARALALRVLREGGATDDARITHAFRLCTGRVPRAEERALLLDLLRGRHDRLAEGWVPVRELAFADPGSLPPLPEGVSPTQVAAWTVVSRVLLNLDETVTKN